MIPWHDTADPPGGPRVTVVGFIVQVRPAEDTEAERPTVPVNPLRAVTMSEVVPVPLPPITTGVV